METHRIYLRNNRNNDTLRKSVGSICRGKPTQKNDCAEDT